MFKKIARGTTLLCFIAFLLTFLSSFTPYYMSINGCKQPSNKSSSLSDASQASKQGRKEGSVVKNRTNERPLDVKEKKKMQYKKI